MEITLEQLEEQKSTEEEKKEEEDEKDYELIGDKEIKAVEDKLEMSESMSKPSKPLKEVDGFIAIDESSYEESSHRSKAGSKNSSQEALALEFGKKYAPGKEEEQDEFVAPPMPEN